MTSGAGCHTCAKEKGTEKKRACADYEHRKPDQAELARRLLPDDELFERSSGVPRPYAEPGQEECHLQ